MTKIAITDASVFDGHELKPPSTIVIADGLIRTTDTTPDAADVVIDGTGCTLLPGFIDCHVHVDTADRLAQFAPAGVTTVLDMGTVLDVSGLRAQANAPFSGLPSFHSAGIFAAHPSSRHAAAFGLSDDQVVKDGSMAEAFVNARLAAGSDYLKLIADVPGFDQATLDALAAAARAKGMCSVAHAAMKVAYERVALARLDVVTHIPPDGVLDDKTVAKLKADGRVCVPTVAMMRAMVPAMRQGMGKDVASFENVLANLDKLHRAGVPICCGTDSNDLPGIAIAFGSGLHQELELMTQGGMSNIEVLRSATSEPAKRFGFTDRGLVKEGMRADLVLVQGNPTEDITVVQNVKKVWIGGVEVRGSPSQPSRK